MKLVTRNAENRLYDMLLMLNEKARETRNTQRCAYFHTSTLKSPDTLEVEHVISQFVDDPDGAAYLLSDNDLFVIASGLTPLLAREMAASVATMKSAQEDHVEIDVTIYDLQVDWFDMMDHVDLKLQKIEGRSTENRYVEDHESPVNIDHLGFFSEENRRELFHIFFDQSRECLDALHESCDMNEPDLWKRSAHKFKGSSANVGAQKLSVLCKQAENGYEQMSRHQKEALLSGIEAEFMNVKQYVETQERL
jgi:HPt (histidine-containing phosphotransfer) domain-containing protein